MVRFFTVRVAGVTMGCNESMSNNGQLKTGHEKHSLVASWGESTSHNDEKSTGLSSLKPKRSKSKPHISSRKGVPVIDKH